MTHLFLVRHGQTVGNVQYVRQGWTEGVLTPLGLQQAEATARYLATCGKTLNALYGSPLRRAWRTAEILGQGLGLSPLAHDGLREICFGEAEGLTTEQFAARYPELYLHWSNRGDTSFTWPGGENRAEFQRRAWRTFEEIVACHKGQSIVLVSHGGTLHVILAHLFPEQLGQWWIYALGNCSLTRVQMTSDGPQLLALNEQSHLSGLTGSAMG